MHAARRFIAQTIRFIAVVLTILGLTWLMLGCASGTVFTVSVDAAAFQDLLRTEMATDARRPAHLMGFSMQGRSSYKAGVLEDARWPEPYAAAIGPSIRPGEYHLAYAAQRLLREQYAATHPRYRALERNELAEIIGEAGGNLYVHEDFAADRVVDLVDVQSRAVFEMVPPGLAHQAAGKEKIDWLLRLINYGMVGQTPFHLGADFHGEMGVRFAERAVPWKLTWATTEPGIVVYQWLALQVDERSEDAYRQAYLEHRWRPVTAQEIAKFGRALHEVVERLVQAREELGQTRAATEMPLLPGKTLADYVRSVALWGAHDDKVAKFLPVMRKPPPPSAPVRRDARFFGQTAPAGGGGGPSGGYTVNGKPGNQPENLFMGIAAHNIIGTDYKVQYPTHKVFTNTVSISTIVKEARGTVELLRPDEALRRPDITDLEVKVIFEIKSSRPGSLAKAQQDLTTNITALNRALPATTQLKPGSLFAGDRWVRFTLDMRWWRLVWNSTAPGVVQYTWTKLDNDEVDEAKIMKGVSEGRFKWIDLTAADEDQYAEKCAEFSEAYAKGAQKLFMMQVAADFAIGVIGNAAIIYLSPGLSAPGKMVQPGALPLPGRPPVTIPAPPPVSVSRPPTTMRPGSGLPPRSPPPPINARSLGSDARPPVTGAAPRPATTGPQNTTPN